MKVTKEVTTTETTQFVELQRIYKLANVPANTPKYDQYTGAKLPNVGMKTQPITVNVGEIADVRPCNRLGFPEHRSTITMANGKEWELTNRYSEVRAAIKA